MTYNANIIITNNTIGQGGYSNGSTTVSYKYDAMLWTYGSSIVEGNVFADPNVASDMLNITEGSCIVRNNKFIRGTTTIASYIKHHFGHNYSEIDEITNNIFDQSTIDGYTEQLVFGLNPGSVYTRNRNQTGYVYIPLFGNTFGTTDTNGPLYNGPDTFNLNINSPIQIRRVKEVSSRSNLITQISDSPDATQTFLNIRKAFDAKGYLETGSLIVSARIGATLPGSVSTIITDFTNCYFKVSVKSHDGIRSMDPFNNFHETPYASYSSEKDITSISDVTALTTSTVYTPVSGASIGTSDGNYYGFIQPDIFRIGNGYQVEIEFQAVLNLADSYTLLMTPIEIKYRW